MSLQYQRYPMFSSVQSHFDKIPFRQVNFIVGKIRTNTLLIIEQEISITKKHCPMIRNTNPCVVVVMLPRARTQFYGRVCARRANASHQSALRNSSMADGLFRIAICFKPWLILFTDGAATTIRNLMSHGALNSEWLHGQLSLLFLTRSLSVTKQQVSSVAQYLAMNLFHG